MRTKSSMPLGKEGIYLKFIGRKDFLAFTKHTVSSHVCFWSGKCACKICTMVQTSDFSLSMCSPNRLAPVSSLLIYSSSGSVFTLNMWKMISRGMIQVRSSLLQWINNYEKIFFPCFEKNERGVYHVYRLL